MIRGKFLKKSINGSVCIGTNKIIVNKYKYVTNVRLAYARNLFLFIETNHLLISMDIIYSV